MKTDLKTGSYPNGSSEPCWTVPDSSATFSPYGHENKENSANLYNSVGYTPNNMIILPSPQNEFIPSGKNGVDHPEKSFRISKNDLKTQYCQPSSNVFDLTIPTKKLSPTTNGCQDTSFSSKTFTTVNDSDRYSNCKDMNRSSNTSDCVAASWSNILNKMPIMKEMKNRPVDNTRCSLSNSNNNNNIKRQRQQTRSSFTQLQKNIQEAVRNFSWWTSGYVHENLNCFSSSRSAPYTHQNRGQHLCHRTTQPFDYYYRPRPVQETRYPCQSNYIPPFCYNPERHCPQLTKKEHPRFCVVNNRIVGQASYPSSNFTKGNGRATTQRPTTCLNKKVRYISKSDWPMSKDRELFEKTHWFRETAKDNSKVPSLQKVNYTTPTRIEVYSILVPPTVTSAMSPANCDESPLPSTRYSKQLEHQEENPSHQNAKICDTPETSMFSPVHWATSGNLAVDSRQMLDLPQVVNQNKEDWLEAGSIISDDDDDDDSSLSDIVLNNGPSSEDDRNDIVKEREQDNSSVGQSEEKSDESVVDLCRCPSPHRKSGLSHYLETDDENDSYSGAESDSDSDSDDDIEDSKDDLEIDGGPVESGLSVCEESDDDLEIDGGPIEFGLSDCVESDDDVEIDGGPVESGLSVCEESDDDLEIDGGPVEFGLSDCVESDDDLEIDGGPVEFGLSVCEESDDDLEIDGGPVESGLSVCEESDDDLEIDGGPVEFGLSVCVGSEDNLKTKELNWCPVQFEVCSMVNNWLIRPDSDTDDSDDDALTQEDEDEDDWDTTWSATSASPVAPPNEIDLMDEFNHFTISTRPFLNCSPSCEKKADDPAIDEVDCGNSQKLKEVNERWNKIYNDDDDDDGFTFEEENNAKKVKFANGKDFATLHLLVCWTYAYRAARKGPWISLALDSERFRKRINELKCVIDPVLDPVHRQNVYSSRLQQAAEKNT